MKWMIHFKILMKYVIEVTLLLIKMTIYIHKFTSVDKLTNGQASMK